MDFSELFTLNHLIILGLLLIIPLGLFVFLKFLKLKRMIIRAVVIIVLIIILYLWITQRI